ncbi:MAG: hypothetical protein KF744_05730 [Taibaiella sp.]|nr:hypothetical protein [Taibaiella sp.]
MRKFCLRIVLFALFIVAIDRPFLLFRYKIINVFSEISENKMKQLSQYVKANNIKSVDIAVYGSSHPQFGISSDIISEQTHKSCLNFAYGGGSNLGAQVDFIKKLDLKSELIIFPTDVYSFSEKNKKIDHFQQVFFGKSSKSVAEKTESNEMNISNLSTDFLRFSNAYMYAHFIPRYLKDVAHKNYTLPYFRKQGAPDLSVFSMYNGYEISRTGWVNGKGYANVQTYRYPWWVFKPEEEAVESLRSLIAYCKQKGTKLCLVQIPEHKLALSYKQKYIDFDNWMRKFAADNEVLYLNYDDAAVFPVDNDSLFYDTDHLNGRGAELFTAQLIAQLRERGMI